MRMNTFALVDVGKCCIVPQGQEAYVFSFTNAKEGKCFSAGIQFYREEIICYIVESL